MRPVAAADAALGRALRVSLCHCSRISISPERPLANLPWLIARGGPWITRWNSGDLFRHDSTSNSWRRWHLPGDRPQPYAVYVDDTDVVWISDWGANEILRFEPKTESFESFPLPDSYASVRQLLAGRKGEGWGAEAAADKLFMIKSE